MAPEREILRREVRIDTGRTTVDYIWLRPKSVGEVWLGPVLV